MKKQIHREATRGHADHGWLNAKHSFSFANYYDSTRVHFGMLRVLNDDIVVAGKGFGAHPHDNMEIVTIPLSGALQHKDNTGRSEIIRSGDVQIMSAGTGIVHSEMNASQDESVNLLQIWVFPKEKDISPRYEQKSFLAEERRNGFQVVVSPEVNEGGVWINQDAKFLLSDPVAGTQLEYTCSFTNSGLYLFVIEGSVEVDGEVLSKRDAIAISETVKISISSKEDSRLLLIELPMN